MLLLYSNSSMRTCVCFFGTLRTIIKYRSSERMCNKLLWKLLHCIKICASALGYRCCVDGEPAFERNAWILEWSVRERGKSESLRQEVILGSRHVLTSTMIFRSFGTGERYDCSTGNTVVFFYLSNFTRFIHTYSSTLTLWFDSNDSVHGHLCRRRVHVVTNAEISTSTGARSSCSHRELSNSGFFSWCYIKFSII